MVKTDILEIKHKLFVFRVWSSGCKWVGHLWGDQLRRCARYTTNSLVSADDFSPVQTCSSSKLAAAPDRVTFLPPHHPPLSLVLFDSDRTLVRVCFEQPTVCNTSSPIQQTCSQSGLVRRRDRRIAARPAAGARVSSYRHRPHRRRRPPWAR